MGKKYPGYGHMKTGIIYPQSAVTVLELWHLKTKPSENSSRREQRRAIVSVMINEFQKSSSVDCDKNRQAILGEKLIQYVATS